MWNHENLGIIIDENLNWMSCVVYLCAVISLLKQLSTYETENIQKIFHQSYILPLIDYGSNAWDATSNMNTEWLNKLQKLAAHIILKTDDFMKPSADVYFKV